MDDGTLRNRLWDGFSRLQALLGGHAGPGHVIEREGIVASVVPSAPDSPTLNAVVALDPDQAPRHLEELGKRYAKANVRRWGVWLDDHASLVAHQLANYGMVVTSASPGMGATLDELQAAPEQPHKADLLTVARVNDIAYGNYDGRLERTLAPLPNGILRAYRQDDTRGRPAAVALALHHQGDCGISFVATVPKARRQGLASAVMRQALTAARKDGCTTTTLQATEVGEKLYSNLGYRRLCVMQLWERRP